MTLALRLKSLCVSVNDMLREVDNNFIKLSPEVLNYRQHAGQWSILDCFEHLNRYARYYIPRMHRALERAPAAASQQPGTSSWLGRKFIAAMHPDNQKKQRTFKRMNPVNTTLGIGVLQEFKDHQRELLGLLQRAETIQVAKTRVPVEFLPVLHMNIADALEFLVVHQQRHVLQAQRQEAVAFLKPGAPPSN